MPLDKTLLEIIVCPVCKGGLDYKPTDNELICSRDKLAFAVKDGIPVLLEDQARSLQQTATPDN